MSAPPELIDSLCGCCRLGDTGICPVYPLQTRYCVEFRPFVHASHDAALIIAHGLREAPDVPQRQARFHLMCEVLTGER